MFEFGAVNLNNSFISFCGDKESDYIISLTFWERIVPLLFRLLVGDHFNHDYLHIFTNPSAGAGYDTRSIFKRSLAGLNSEFSFS